MSKSVGADVGLLRNSQDARRLALAE
jgi:hypothetical protein